MHKYTTLNDVLHLHHFSIVRLVHTIPQRHMWCANIIYICAVLSALYA